MYLLERAERHLSVLLGAHHLGLQRGDLFVEFGYSLGQAALRRGQRALQRCHALDRLCSAGSAHR